jgi:hypothetical protein
MARFQVGDPVVCHSSWRALTLASLPAEVRALTNPTTIACSVEAPDGTTSTPTPVNVSTGVYYVVFTASQAGRYVITWTGTGSAAGVEQQIVDVRALT